LPAAKEDSESGKDRLLTPALSSIEEEREKILKNSSTIFWEVF